MHPVSQSVIHVPVQPVQPPEHPVPQFVVHVVEHPVHCELQPEHDVLASAEATELQPEHVLLQVAIHELDAQTPSQSFLHVAEHCV